MNAIYGCDIHIAPTFTLLNMLYIQFSFVHSHFNFDGFGFNCVTLAFPYQNHHSLSTQNTHIFCVDGRIKTKSKSFDTDEHFSSVFFLLLSFNVVVVVIIIYSIYDYVEFPILFILFFGIGVSIDVCSVFISVFHR